MTLAYGKRVESRMNREIKELTRLYTTILLLLSLRRSLDLWKLSLYLTDCPAGLLHGKGWVMRF
jgi:hypothetical protein